MMALPRAPVTVDRHFSIGKLDGNRWGFLVQVKGAKPDLSQWHPSISNQPKLKRTPMHVSLMSKDEEH